ncbi:hypothetical protein PsorP6_017550 [Peronosclerospora sorghi]|uniref:Uncharacterized protein n=1 Tax=Peronosclerospora sorghi TaxID=230839 RepID=A0ACC0WPL3_9STRA|nr:hypothetical protein PsorP6_017550 [Peronosclerospora sorghi]
MMEECAQPAAAGWLFRSWSDTIAQHDFDDSDEAEEGARQQEQESRGDDSQERQEADPDRPPFPPCMTQIFRSRLAYQDFADKRSHWNSCLA